jgi:histidinol-phosphate aminotransferase
MTKSKRALDFVQPHLLTLQSYEAVDPPEVLARRAGVAEAGIIKLDANENPYGASPKVAEALAAINRVHLYPDPAQIAMRTAAGAYVGIGMEHVIVGNGSDEIIDLLFRATLAPGDAVLTCVPTFGMYEFTAHVCGGRTVSVDRTADFEVNVDTVLGSLDETVKIIALASPNNPSGNSVPPEVIRRLLATDRLVIIDEAYVEFGGASMIPEVPNYANLAVLRTLSKWGGLAGLRVGYGVMDVELTDLLLRAKPPYNVNQAAEAAMLASFADAGTLNERARLIVAERKRMEKALSQLPGVTPLPSEANFILCRLQDGRGRAVYDTLAQQGVFVRYYSRGQLVDYLRISVGTPPQTDTLIEALAQAL